MAAYCTLAQLTDRFGEQMLLQLADRAVPPAGEVEEAIVGRAIADTGAVIDGYLAGRYQLPIAGDVPALLVDLALIIAIYKLHTYTPDQKIIDDYNGALKQLRDLSTGTIKLAVAGVEPEVSGAGGVETIDRDRDLTPENLKGFI